MVKRNYEAHPKVLPSLIDNSKKTRFRIIKSAIEKISDFGLLLLCKIKKKKVISLKELDYLINALRKLNSYAKFKNKKKSIYKRWDQLRLSLVNIYIKRNNFKIKKLKKIRSNNKY